MLMLLAKFELDGWFHFFQKQGIIKKIGFPLKSGDVIMMSSKVHEWKGKPKVYCLTSVFDATDH